MKEVQEVLIDKEPRLSSDDSRARYFQVLSIDRFIFAAIYGNSR